jgi:hypothetical protein
MTDGTTARALIHRPFHDGGWGDPASLGGALASAPATTAWGPDQLLGRKLVAPLGVARR